MKQFAFLSPSSLFSVPLLLLPIKQSSPLILVPTNLLHKEFQHHKNSIPSYFLIHTNNSSDDNLVYRNSSKISFSTNFGVD